MSNTKKASEKAVFSIQTRAVATGVVEIAKLCGCDYTHMGRVLKGLRAPSAKLAAKLAEHGINIGYAKKAYLNDRA